MHIYTSAIFKYIPLTLINSNFQITQFNSVRQESIFLNHRKWQTYIGNNKLLNQNNCTMYNLRWLGYHRNRIKFDTPE